MQNKKSLSEALEIKSNARDLKIFFINIILQSNEQYFHPNF